ncbi:pleckstrin-2 [Ambystoma mexicanum]|uniref:pleckstrin-2 n=1 Tax=Ambystoma mexicanum TaxID=8296 RepID=UPI0037E8F16A
MGEENEILKEGFLVKRGHFVLNWKSRWFVLQNDKLLYYKLDGGQKRESGLKGRILLDGCSIICPCLEYENRPLVIKLKTKTSTDYFFEACSREDRDAWAADITKAIQALNPEKAEPLRDLKSSFKLPTNINLNHIVDAMNDSSNGIKPVPKNDQGGIYKDSYSGSALVDWLVSRNFACTRFEGVTLASMLIVENFIKPIGIRSNEAMRTGDLAEQFLDDSTALYTYAESKKKKNSFKEDFQLNTMELSGTVQKQGYLAKQGHKRKNWKVRLFVLRSDPAFLHYYDPTREDNRPVGGFSLRGCLISALEDNGVPFGVKGNVQGNLFKIITQKDIHYFIQASSKAERSEWIEAIKRLT